MPILDWVAIGFGAFCYNRFISSNKKCLGGRRWRSTASLVRVNEGRLLLEQGWIGKYYFSKTAEPFQCSGWEERKASQPSSQAPVHSFTSDGALMQNTGQPFTIQMWKNGTHPSKAGQGNQGHEPTMRIIRFMAIHRLNPTSVEAGQVYWVDEGINDPRIRRPNYLQMIHDSCDRSVLAGLILIAGPILLKMVPLFKKLSFASIILRMRYWSIDFFKWVWSRESATV